MKDILWLERAKRREKEEKGAEEREENKKENKWSKRDFIITLNGCAERSNAVIEIMP